MNKKSMTKIITRRQVLRALRTEPSIYSGSFFRGDKPNCKVCAVGAVLRQVSFEKYLRDNDCRINDVVYDNMNDAGGFSDRDCFEDELANKNWLGALSVYFEQGNSVKKCIEFVKKYFPPSFEFTINI